MQLLTLNSYSLGDLCLDTIRLLLQVTKDTLVLMTVGLGRTDDIVIVTAGVLLKTVDTLRTRGMKLSVLDAIEGNVLRYWGTSSLLLLSFLPLKCF